MVTTVTGKNQITLPADVVRALRIRRGSIIEWTVDAKTKGGRFKVLPSRGELALKLLGAGRKYGMPGESWVEELVSARIRDDDERSRSLEGK